MEVMNNQQAFGQIKRILDNFNGLVVIDEAYIDFTAVRSWIEDLLAYPNLVVTQTLSKAYGLAGIRMGICYASSEIIAILNKIKPPYNINILTQKAALEVLSEDSVTQKQVQIIFLAGGAGSGKGFAKDKFIESDVELDELATFDIEYIFIQIRANSVGETAKLQITDKEFGYSRVIIFRKEN